MPGMRLQKFLSHAGVCSRRKAEFYIRAGRVSVNGKLVYEMGLSVDPERDRVAFDGKEVTPVSRPVTIALNKPAGYVTSCDHPGQKIVLDLVDLPGRLYPVGRLDKESTGLLLLTNEGPLHHRLSHPSFDHEKEYRVTVKEPISDQNLERLASGVEVLGKQTRRATVSRMGPRQFRIVLKEGRNRQIRRMVEEVDNQVTSLHRVRIAHIRLGRLPKGKWRALTPEERKELDNLLKTPATSGRQKRKE